MFKFFSVYVNLMIVCRNDRVVGVDSKELWEFGSFSSWSLQFTRLALLQSLRSLFAPVHKVISVGSVQTG